MKKRYSIYRILKRLSLLILSAIAINNATANLETVKANIAERQTEHIELAIANSKNMIDTFAMQALNGVAINENALDAAIEAMLSSSNADFYITKFIRLMQYTDQYDSKILPALRQFSYWLTPGEETQTYWSENHMSMWMSAHWILKEQYGWVADTDLRKRLVQFLTLKINYGYYEFLSPTYFPYTLSGILNLADFAEDQEIKQLATEAAHALLSTVLLAVNNKGNYFPAAGRSYVNKYLATNQNHNRLFYILLGYGEKPTTSSAISGFIATTAVDFSTQVSNWRSWRNETYAFGHSINEGKSLNSNLNRRDRTIFQWSHGGYLHPDTAIDTAWLINNYDLNDHSAFEAYAQWLPNWGDLASGAANIGATFSRSSNLSEGLINIYKNRGVVLSSLDGYYEGYFGYQQFPWVATIDDLAVWTQSGQVKNWSSRANDYLANTHLPFVKQNGSLALIMYWPNTEISAGSYVSDLSTDVALYWPATQFDETTSHGKWLMGRKGTSYIAILRHCTGTISGLPACTGASGRQMWAAYVGNEAINGSWDEFINTIQESSYRFSYTFNFWRAEFSYYSRVTVGDKEVKHTWKENHY